MLSAELGLTATSGKGSAGDAAGPWLTSRRYMASIIGRSDWPNGVERKRVGKSVISDGTLESVRNATTSAVNELQLKSVQRRVKVRGLKCEQGLGLPFR
jgi:hypothetical protein